MAEGYYDRNERVMKEKVGGPDSDLLLQRDKHEDVKAVLAAAFQIPEIVKKNRLSATGNCLWG